MTSPGSLITIFTLPSCPHCAASLRTLSSLNYHPVIFDVGSEPWRLRQLNSLLGSTFNGKFPQIFIGRRAIGGNQDLQQLHADGTLEATVEGKEGLSYLRRVSLIYHLCILLPLCLSPFVCDFPLSGYGFAP